VHRVFASHCCFLLLTLKSLFSVSTGIRFSTQPDASPPSAQIPPPNPMSPEPPASSPVASSSSSNHHTPHHRLHPSQPPTTITALFNPMLGHIQTAYTARVSRDLALSSRFDFNVYSYESEWTMGAEWWLRRSARTHSGDQEDHESEEVSKASFPSSLGEVHGVVKARASTNNVCFSFRYWPLRIRYTYWYHFFSRTFR
jgi:distribution and morphology protein 10